MSLCEECREGLCAQVVLLLCVGSPLLSVISFPIFAIVGVKSSGGDAPYHTYHLYHVHSAKHGNIIKKSETFIALAPLRMSSSIDCFLSVCFRHSELMGRESRSRASRTVGQAKAPLVTLVLPLTNRTMPSFSSKDEK